MHSSLQEYSDFCAVSARPALPCVGLRSKSLRFLDCQVGAELEFFFFFPSSLPDNLSFTLGRSFHDLISVFSCRPQSVPPPHVLEVERFLADSHSKLKVGFESSIGLYADLCRPGPCRGCHNQHSQDPAAGGGDRGAAGTQAASSGEIVRRAALFCLYLSIPPSYTLRFASRRRCSSADSPTAPWRRPRAEIGRRRLCGF